jgi:hypothetical protein
MNSRHDPGGLSFAVRCNASAYGILDTTSSVGRSQPDKHVGGNDALVYAMLDRLLHHSHVLMMQGESWRLKSKRRAGVLRGSSAEAVG